MRCSARATSSARPSAKSACAPARRSRRPRTSTPARCSTPRSRSSPARVGHVVDRDVEVAELLEPLPDVAAAIASRQARVPAHGDRHLAARPGELERELLARRAGADDEDAAGRQRPGAPVAGGMQREHPRGHRGRRGGQERRVAVPRGDDDVAGHPRAAVRVHLVAAGRGSHPGDRDALDDGGGERPRVLLQSRHELPATRERAGLAEQPLAREQVGPRG
jgi:hypothetical protein